MRRGSVDRMAGVKRLWRLTQLGAHIAAGWLLAHAVIAPTSGFRSGHECAMHRAIVAWWMHRLCRILNLRSRICGQVNTSPTLFVANHISWLDIPVLFSAFDACFVAKADMERWPLIGGMAAAVGTIFLARGEHDAAARTSQRIAFALAQRHHVVIFPEATTTDGLRLGRFHPRLYQAAMHVNGPIQAIAIRYPNAAQDGTSGPGAVSTTVPFVSDDNLLHHLWRLLEEDCIDVELGFCRALRPAGRDRRALAELTRQQIAVALGIAAQAEDRAVHRINAAP